MIWKEIIPSIFDLVTLRCDSKRDGWWYKHWVVSVYPIFGWSGRKKFSLFSRQVFCTELNKTKSNQLIAICFCAEVFLEVHSMDLNIDSIPILCTKQSSSNAYLLFCAFSVCVLIMKAVICLNRRSSLLSCLTMGVSIHRVAILKQVLYQQPGN